MSNILVHLPSYEGLPLSHRVAAFVKKSSYDISLYNLCRVILELHNDIEGNVLNYFSGLSKIGFFALELDVTGDPKVKKLDFKRMKVLEVKVIETGNVQVCMIGNYKG